MAEKGGYENFRQVEPGQPSDHSKEIDKEANERNSCNDGRHRRSHQRQNSYSHRPQDRARSFESGSKQRRKEPEQQQPGEECCSQTYRLPKIEARPGVGPRGRLGKMGRSLARNRNLGIDVDVFLLFHIRRQIPSHTRGSQYTQMTRASGKVPTDGTSDIRGHGKCGKVAPHGAVCAHLFAECDHIAIDARTRVHPDVLGKCVEAAGHLSAEAKTLGTGKDVAP